MNEIDQYGVPLDDYEGDGWYPQYRRSQRWARAEYPEGYNVELPGHHAWATLDAQRREEALGSLFYAYWSLLRDEDNERRLDKLADDGTSYLKPSDIPLLWEYMNAGANTCGEIRADKAALMNVLCEVELLQHRLTRFERNETTNTSADDSGES